MNNMKRFLEYPRQNKAEGTAGSFFQQRAVVDNALCVVLIDTAGFER